VEVGVHVERETVIGHPAFHGDADGGDFARADPDAGLALAARAFESEDGDALDEHLFEEAQVGVQVLSWCQVDDRIADDLAGAVVGDVAATVRFDD